MPNPSEYYALMQALQQPGMQRRQTQREGISNLMNTITQGVLKQKVKKDIETKIAEAEKSGKKVEYKIDPQTGMITPVISSNDYANIFKALENPEVSKDYELGRDSKGKPRLIAKKKLKSNLIAGMQSAIQGEGNILWPKTTIKNPATGQDETIDITNEEDIGRVLAYHGIEDWRNNPELIEAGIPAAYDARIKGWKGKQAQIEAGAEPKVQPYAKGIGRIGGMGAEYKEAAAIYGEAKTKQIVDTIISLQKQGKSLKQIRKLLEEAKVDANAFLKPYGK